MWRHVVLLQRQLTLVQFFGEIDDGEFKDSAWVNKAKVEGDVNKAAT